MRRMNIQISNLRHLHIALHIRDNMGFSNASKAIHLSPSAVAQAMNKLEKILGTTLFDRSVKGAFPNEAGMIYLARIDRAFNFLEQAEAVLVGKLEKPLIYSRVTAAHIRAFKAVVKAGSYSLAARRLGLSQPSIYKATRSIEILYGKQLLYPCWSGVRPDVKALEFVRLTGLALSEIERAREEINEYSGLMEGHISIGALPLVRSKILPRAVNHTLKDYPSAQIMIVDGPYTSLLDALRHGELDIVVGALRSPVPSKDIRQKQLFDDTLSVIVRGDHSILNRNKVELEDLSHLDWVVPRQGTPTRHFFDNLFKSIIDENKPHIVECSSMIATREMLLHSNRAALLSANQAAHEIHNGELAVVDRPMIGSSRPIGVTTRADWKPTKLQTHFIGYLEREAAAYNKN